MRLAFRFMRTYEVVVAVLCMLAILSSVLAVGLFDEAHAQDDYICDICSSDPCRDETPSSVEHCTQVYAACSSGSGDCDPLTGQYCGILEVWDFGVCQPVGAGCGRAPCQ